MIHNRKFFQKAGLFSLTLPVYLIIFLPVIWLVSSSVSNRSDLLALPASFFPKHPTFENYISIFNPEFATSEVSKTFVRTLGNSFLISSSVTFIALFVGSLAAYALARINFPFRKGVLMGILGTRMIPEVSLVIPLYLLASRLGYLNKPIVLIVTYLSFALPFAIWIMTGFFETIPVELEDAARIDGCSRMGILYRVILPISAPGLISTSLFVFLSAWDEFFFALIFTSTIATKTVPVAIAEFTGRYAVDITAMMAGGVIAAIPPVVLALIFQRYIISGLTAGAVKG
ncbi:MAG: carbohydrate ABC transporter permease [Anaerolineales bacterium]|nr:carbohydrate ABC transporter permease [Anaerolineales bacterium]